MLIFGDYTCIPNGNVFGNVPITVCNFSSYVQDCNQLLNLLPERGVDSSSDENFDMSYFDYIFCNDRSFMDFMFIVTKLYEGHTVYIIINHTEFYDKLAESLAEIIKQRYGYLSYFVYDMGDYNMDFEQAEFSVIGLNNLDMDKMRFLNLLGQMNMLHDDPDDYS